MSTLRRAAVLAATLAMVPALMGADGGCVHTNRSPYDRQVDKRVAYRVDIITDSTGPYEVRYRTAEVGTLRGDWSGWKPIPGGEFVADVHYMPKAPNIEVMVDVKARSDELLSCRIEDGEHNVNSQTGLGRIQCGLVTNRAKP